MYPNLVFHNLIFAFVFNAEEKRGGSGLRRDKGGTDCGKEEGETVRFCPSFHAGVILSVIHILILLL